MGSPCHISGSASPLFFQDKSSTQYEALSVIAQLLGHPQRTLLSTFISHAADPELAARFFLNEVSGCKRAAVLEILADWISLLRKIRPVIGTDVEESLEKDVWRRDGGRCCVSKVEGGSLSDGSLLLTFVLPPSLFSDCDMIDNGRLYQMFAAYVGESQLQNLRSFASPESLNSERSPSDQLMLLSPGIFEHFRNGRLSLKESLPTARANSARYLVKVRNFIPTIRLKGFDFVELENKAVGLASLPNAQYLNVHHRFADVLAWLEVSDYMKQTCRPSNGPEMQKLISYPKELSAIKILQTQRCSTRAQTVFRHIWIQTPKFFRAYVYKCFVRISKRFYEDTGSYRTFRLPFNLFLRVDKSNWASKHEAEFQSLCLVEKHTRTPAPIAIDTFFYRESSFLLMTGLPGRMIGRMVHTMTDEQLFAVGQDLKEYIEELRRIPKPPKLGSEICNALGGGILDWRIGDSQREELRFEDEARFNQYLTYDLPLDTDARNLVSKSHSVKHDIVFTHADLNLRNILVDQSGKISRIVDWECAGWYPEYWEYTKAHFGVRYTIRWIADVIDRVFTGYRTE